MIRISHIVVEAPRDKRGGDCQPVRVQLMDDNGVWYYRLDTHTGSINLSVRQMHCLREALNIITNGREGVDTDAGVNPLVEVMRAMGVKSE